MAVPTADHADPRHQRRVRSGLRATGREPLIMAGMLTQATTPAAGLVAARLLTEPHTTRTT